MNLYRTYLDISDFPTKHGAIPTLFLGVPALPKGALVEKQVMVHTGRFVVLEDGETEIKSREPIIASGALYSLPVEVYYVLKRQSASASDR